MRLAANHAARALAGRLLELAGVVDQLDDTTYREARVDGVSGSIGAHVRHSLDHVRAIVEPVVAGVIDYDHRPRGTDIERSSHAGAAALRRLARRISRWPAEAAGIAITLSAVVDPTGTRVLAGTTVGREIVFALSHTIHHQAIIALLLAEAGVHAPSRFGLAPSTPTPRARGDACAQSA